MVPAHRVLPCLAISCLRVARLRLRAAGMVANSYRAKATAITIELGDIVANFPPTRTQNVITFTLAVLPDVVRGCCINQVLVFAQGKRGNGTELAVEMSGRCSAFVNVVHINCSPCPILSATIPLYLTREG